VLECKHCGFEFMVKADVEQKDLKKPDLKRIDFELAALRKKVKSFDLA